MDAKLEHDDMCWTKCVIQQCSNKTKYTRCAFDCAVQCVKQGDYIPVHNNDKKKKCKNYLDFSPK